MLLAELPHALVHVGHELVEMHAPLAPDRRGLEEQVHQHGLAAADVAVDVESLDRLLPCARARRTASRAPTICARADARAAALPARPGACDARAPAPDRARSLRRQPAPRTGMSRGKASAAQSRRQRIGRFHHIGPAADRGARGEQDEARDRERQRRDQRARARDSRRPAGSTSRAAARASHAACICAPPAQARRAASAARARPAIPSAPASAPASRSPRAGGVPPNDDSVSKRSSNGVRRTRPSSEATSFSVCVIDVADEAQRHVIVLGIDPARAGQAAAQHATSDWATFSGISRPVKMRGMAVRNKQKAEGKSTI